jgi:restriction endonuclease Mrr
MTHSSTNAERARSTGVRPGQTAPYFIRGKPRAAASALPGDSTSCQRKPLAVNRDMKILCLPLSALEFFGNIDQKIILIDGRRLAELMIQHNVGVTVKQVFEVKEIDSDYFEEG